MALQLLNGYFESFLVAIRQSPLGFCSEPVIGLQIGLHVIGCGLVKFNTPYRFSANKRVTYQTISEILFVVITFYLLGVSAMVYKIKYYEDADVLTVILEGKGKLFHAEEIGDVIVHFDENGKPLFMEILKASKMVPQ